MYITPRLLSDHSPVVCKIKELMEVRKIWRINEDLLDKQETVNQLKEEIKNYFEINDTPEIKSSILWDAFKVVIRGKSINLNAITRKNRNEKLEQLQKELEKVGKDLKKRPGKKTLEKQRSLLKQQINAFDTQEMVWGLKKVQQRIFEGSNKPGNILHIKEDMIKSSNQNLSFFG